MVQILTGDNVERSANAKEIEFITNAILQMFAAMNLDAEVGINAALNIAAMSFHGYALSSGITQEEALKEFDEMQAGLRQALIECWDRPAVEMSRSDKNKDH